MRHTIKIAAVAAGIVAGLAVPGAAYGGRNSSGTMSFTSVAGGYPFQSGQTVSSAGVNSNFSELATELSDSLSRSGKGGMSAPLRCADGTAAAPAFSWTSDTNTGFYRIGADNVGLALGGSKYVDFSTSGLAVTGWAAFSSTVTGAGYSGGPISGTTGAFSGAVSMTGGNFSMSQAAGQTITKSGGALQIGTTDNNNVTILRNGAAAALFNASGMDLGGTYIGNVHDPLSAQDAATKNYVDVTHNGVTDAHGAVSAATASRIVLRDASGRASVADPSSSTDIATKAYVDAYTATASSATGGTGWTISTNSVRKRSGLVTVHMVALAGVSGGWSSIATLPAGYRPAETFIAWGRCYDGTTTFGCEINIDSAGVVSAVRYDNGTSLVSMWALGSDDSMAFTYTFIEN